MSDLISRQDAIDVLEILADKMSDEGQTVMAQVVAVLKDLRSVEPERIAKVSNQIFNNSNPYTVGAWIGTCECGELVSYSSKYCHMCGAKLEWE